MKYFGVTDEQKIFEGFTNVSKNSDVKVFFFMFGAGKLIAKVLLSWRKSFSFGVLIPHNKTRNCHNCSKDIYCDDCDNLANQ